LSVLDPGTHALTATYEGDGNFTPSAASLSQRVKGVADHLLVTAPAGATAGSPFSVTVTAQDEDGVTATGYRGTAPLSSWDTAAGVFLPSDYTFTDFDQGVHPFFADSRGGATFGGVALDTAGSQQVTVTDTTTGTVTGSTIIQVN